MKTETALTLRSIHKFLLLCSLACLWPWLLQAQAQQGATTEGVAPRDTLAERAGGFTYIPEELRVGLDLSRIIVGMVNPETRFVELNSDLRFGSYYLAADLGTGSLERTSGQVDYRASGTYLRIGPDINLIPENEDRNTMFLGLRYGRSWYHERLNTVYEEEGWESFPMQIDRQARSGWFEVVAGMKAMVLNNLYLGYTMRLKFGLMAEDSHNFSSYEVPGFGRANGTNFAFNYHLLYRIPFARKQPAPAPLRPVP